MNLVPKNWRQFQHYGNRRPPWIKLHRELLDDREFMCLPLASKALAPMLWLLASESKTGEFNAKVEDLAFRLRLTEKEVMDGLTPLINKGFFVDASTMLAICLQPASPEREGEGETEKRKPQSRGTRLPADWNPSEQDIAFCKSERPDLNPKAVADRFRDFWIAQPGTKGVKLDWVATWRNWVRNEKAVNSAPAQPTRRAI